MKIFNDKKALAKYSLFILGIFMIFAVMLYASGFVVSGDSSPTVTTDKEDYAPEETVLISGEGFVPNSTLLVKVTRGDDSVVSGDGLFEAWPKDYDYVTADSSGDFEFSYILDGVEGEYLIEVLDGDENGDVLASASFTDYDMKIDEPDAGDIVSGTIDIEWHYHWNYMGFNYKVYYKDGGSCGQRDITDWNLIDTIYCDTYVCTLSWDTTSVSNGDDYCIGVEKTSGDYKEDREGTFEIDNEPETVDITIIAHKIVCDSESDLPDWSGTGPYIGSSTASDYVSQHPNCHFEENWNFQWADNDEENPGDNIESAGTPWVTFGPTDSNGETSVVINDADSIGTIWFREELKSGYIPFSGVGGSDVTAEFYCDGDVLNYDNYDFIDEEIEDGDTFYCVAFNALASYCGDGQVNQQSEECDDGNNDDGNTGDNAPVPGVDESAKRNPDGKDTDVDSNDFIIVSVPI